MNELAALLVETFAAAFAMMSALIVGAYLALWLVDLIVRVFSPDESRI
jgi:hypothetical protein